MADGQDGRKVHFSRLWSHHSISSLCTKEVAGTLSRALLHGQFHLDLYVVQTMFTDSPRA